MQQPIIVSYIAYYRKGNKGSNLMSNYEYKLRDRIVLTKEKLGKGKLYFKIILINNTSFDFEYLFSTNE